MTYFVTGPAVELAVHENAQVGQEHGEKVNNKRQQQFGNYRQQIEVAEGEQNHKCHDRQIKRREYQRHHLGRKHQPRNAVLAVKADGRVNLFDRVVHEFTLFVEILIRFYPFLSVNFAQARRRNVEHIAVFGHGAAGHVVALLFEFGGQGFIGQRVVLVFFVDQFFECSLYLAGAMAFST